MNLSLRVVTVAVLLTVPNLQAQQRGQAAPPPPPTPRSIAPVDLTGYWVSLVTEDWRFRMVVPPKGDYASMPLNQEAIKEANAWDPAKDEAAGNQCKFYGAGAIMRVPARLHITWQDDNTLRIETDAGTQTRMFKFAPSKPQGGQATWQGESVASWDFIGARGAPLSGGGLKVVTTGMRSGYLRRNGVPYSENAVITEYFDRLNPPGADSYLVVKTIVDDPKYLNLPFITSTNFKRLPDATGWNPTPCEIFRPLR